LRQCSHGHAAFPHGGKHRVARVIGNPAFPYIPSARRFPMVAKSEIRPRVLTRPTAQRRHRSIEPSRCRCCEHRTQRYRVLLRCATARIPERDGQASLIDDRPRREHVRAARLWWPWQQGHERSWRARCWRGSREQVAIRVAIHTPCGYRRSSFRISETAPHLLVLQSG
jgi:hypothetical protein